MANTKTSLKQAELSIAVEGMVSENTLKSSIEQGVEHIEGNIVVQTSPVNFVTFRVNTDAKKKRDKKFTDEDNKTFKGIKTVMEQYKSIADHGREEATCVRVNGQINPYGYYGQDKLYHEGVGYKASFFNRISEEECEAKSTFSIQMYIKSIRREVDKEGEETGRVIIDGWSPTYSGIEKIQLIAPETYGEGDEEYEVASAVEEEYEAGQTVTFYGEAVNNKVVVAKTTPVKIGKPKTEVHSEYKNEFIVTGVGEPLPEETAYSKEAIEQAIQERETRLEEQKNSKSQSNSGVGNGGFTGKAAPSGRSLPNF